MIIESKIKSVTVYKDRALVERSAKTNLTEGEHQLVFSGLPTGIDTNSLQVTGGQKCVLQDLKVKDVYHEEVTDEQKKDILLEIEELQYLIEETTDRMNNASEEKALLHNIANVTAETSKKAVLNLFVPEKMEQVLKFYNQKLNAHDDFIRSSKKELKKLEHRMSVLNNEIGKYNSGSLKAEKQVELKVFIKEAAEVELFLSYIIMNAGWSPIYDLRLNSNEKKLGVSYNAIINQQTGESWEDVELKLSTAQPQLSGTSPNLYPWYVDIYVPAPPPPPQMKKKAKAMKKDLMRSASMTVAPEGLLDSGFAMAEEEAPMDFEEAVVETGATSVIFAIPGTNTVLDNYEDHKVGITSFDLDAELEYNSIPKLTPFAYLTSKSTNTSDFPLLAGKTNIFLDGAFVSNSKLKLVAPNEKFKTSLGADEGVKIEHKLVNKYTKDEGLFSKKNKVSYEYKILVANNKKSESLIKIKDQMPLSQNQEIKVELIAPKIKENNEELKKHEDGTIEWSLTLQPGEKTELQLKFSLEYPRNETITGLE